MDNEKGELVFLRYAFPVLGYCNDIKIREREKFDYENALKHGGNVSRDRLQELFPNAVKHLKSWSAEDVGDYWLKEHNGIVGDNYMCKVYPARIKDVLTPINNESCRVIVHGLEHRILNSYIELQPQDEVSIHAFMVAEKLSPPDMHKYFLRK